MSTKLDAQARTIIPYSSKKIGRRPGWHGTIVGVSVGRVIRQSALARDNIEMEVGFHADLIVQGLILVELKSVEAVHPVWKKTLVTYLRLADKRLGLLLNFAEELVKNGLVRVAKGLKEEHHAESQGSQRTLAA